jgi:hypothetical protein
MLIFYAAKTISRHETMTLKRVCMVTTLCNYFPSLSSHMRIEQTTAGAEQENTGN